MLHVDGDIERARAKWKYRGDRRPDFAESVSADEESVWDFPRPPRIEPVGRSLSVLHDGAVVARTERGVRVLETAGAPTYYFPPQDVVEDRLIPLSGRSLCEWKGIAISFRLGEVVPAAWRYEETFPEFHSICGWYGFYPTMLGCFVDEERVEPQPGGYYGGWATANLRGPVKGESGTERW